MIWWYLLASVAITVAIQVLGRYQSKSKLPRYSYYAYAIMALAFLKTKLMIAIAKLNR